MKNATVLKPFKDLTEGVFRNPGDSFTVDDERGSYLASIGLVEATEKPKRRVKKSEE